MFRYFQFDAIASQTKKSKIIKVMINLIIISLIIIILLFNINTKDDIKISSRRIISSLNNYTETMSDFIVSKTDFINDNEINEIKNEMDEINEIKNIRLSIDYFKELKEKEMKLKEMKKEEIRLEKLKVEKMEDLKIKNEKAIDLIKSYIPNYNSLINLVSTHSIIDGYSNNFNCMKEILKINNEELFNNLIKIDYENLEVSFNYLDENESYYNDHNNIIKSHLYSNYDENNRYYNYSHYLYKNYRENVIKNPLYQIIKEKLEINYSYTEPNLTDEYNNKSKYFQTSHNNFMAILNNYNYRSWDKYYENYTDDTYYLYYKNIEYNIDYYRNIITTSFYNYVELLIENKIIINNSNPNDIYSKYPNKYPYKIICDIPSRSMNTPEIIQNYLYKSSMYTNYRVGHLYPTDIKANTIENILNIDINDIDLLKKDCYKIYCFIDIHNDYYKIINGNGNFIINNNILYDLDKNKGSRMVKHNLTNNMPLYSYNDYFTIFNHYFIENITINFPLITIYDEYDYIKILLSNIADIYNLPIIKPIKFM
jgi:hypothetical protein